jgi:lipid-binding SYLF domain-containing protein
LERRAKHNNKQSRRFVVTKIFRAVLVAMFLAFVSGAAWADDDADTIQLFKNAGQSGTFFSKSYGYAVFPTIGKAGLGIGGAHGDGHVYEKGKVIGETSMTQLSIGLQAGGQAYSEIVFFQDKRSLDEFTGGNFEFGAGMNAIAITASAGASAGTTGSEAGASGGKKDATTAGAYYKGMAVFTIAKGGLMYEASISGQKFKFERTGK